MKKMWKKIVAFVVAIACIFTMNNITIKAGTNTEFTKAAQMTIGTEKSGSISPECEENYYYFKTNDKTCYYQITGTTTNTDASFYMALIDKEYNDIDEVAFDIQEPGTLTYKLEKNKVYYIRVLTSGAEVNAAYKVKITQLPDDYDNTMEGSSSIQLNTDIAGVFERVDDEDYMNFKTDNVNSFYQIDYTNLTTAEDAGDIELELYSADGDIVQNTTVSPNGTETFIVKLDNNSQYYLRAFAYSYPETETGKYSIKVTKIVDAEGDSFETATVLDMNAPDKEYTLQAETDEDYFVFTPVVQGPMYDITVSNLNLISQGLTANIFDENYKNVDAIYVNGDESVTQTYQLDANKKYYIQVLEAEAGTSYKIAVKKSDAKPDIPQTGAPTASSNPTQTGGPTTSLNPTQTGAPTASSNPAQTGNPTVSQNPVQSGVPAVSPDPTQTGEPVVSPSPEPAKKYVAVKKVTLNKKKLTLKKGKKYTLKATIKPKKADIASIKWSSSKKKVASVTKKGVVKALKAGKTKIKCVYKSKDGTKKSATCVVTVKK